MVTAKFYTEEGSVGLSMVGHAGHGKKGEDIVCAAASILAYTAAQSVAFMAAQGKLTDAPVIILEPGKCLVKARPADKYLYELFHTFFVVQVGFSLLATRYPENVKLDAFC